MIQSLTEGGRGYSTLTQDEWYPMSVLFIHPIDSLRTFRAICPSTTWQVQLKAEQRSWP